MTRSILLAATALALAAAPALSAQTGEGGATAAVAETALAMETVNAAAFGGEAADEADISPVVLKAQVLMDRAHMSPGVIDGRHGENTSKALERFQKAKGLEITGTLDETTWAALTAGGQDNVLREYALSEEDVAGPFHDVPESDYRAMSEMEALTYERASEALAERFHMDEELLLELNPEAEFAAGETIIVADAGANLESGKVARIEADKALGALRAYDSSGALLAAYPATIGSSDTPSPSGEMKVTAIAPAPTYTYNPEVNFDAGPDEILILPAGPNGPVGGTWIDLEKETYGIHGTPDPAKVDKEFSHGCVRLTNWDAAELAGLVVDGETVVTFVETPEG